MPDATPLAAARVSLFAHAYSPVSGATLTWPQAIEDIATGKYRSQVCEVRQVLARDGERAYRKAKNNLPAFTFGGTFAPKRGIAHLQQHSGLIHGDLDHLSDVKAGKRAICSDPRTAYAFESPSVAGLKIGIHGPVVADGAEYEYAWRVVSAEYARLHGIAWDQSGRDVSRLCFVSYDPEAYWNPDAAVFEVPPAPPIQESPQPTFLAPSATTHAIDRSDGYAVSAIQTAVRMIHAARLGTRHHTRLRASRLLGGYVAGGFLSYDQAYAVLEHALVGHTDDLKRALKTVEDGLAYGAAHPITLAALEAERRAWLDRHFMRSRLNPVHGDDQGLSLLPLRPYAPYRGPATGAWHG
jgi:VirE N-terminal domain